jgi:hypothetical protein
MSILRAEIQFPFEYGGKYTIGQLRRFERELSIARQSDKSLSKAWRVPETGEMKRRVKIREETYPIKLLADHKSYDDDAVFSLKPFGYPSIDAEICSANETYNLQITIADPVWNGQNGGYDHRLVMEALNSRGVIHGSSFMRREGGKIVSGLPVKSFDEEFEGCRQGLISALQRKLAAGAGGSRLLIHARGYSIHTMDFTLAEVVNAAMTEVAAEIGKSAFDMVFVIDEGNDQFFERRI